VSNLGLKVGTSWNIKKKVRDKKILISQENHFEILKNKSISKVSSDKFGLKKERKFD
jgi:hypothetical protein